MNETADSIASMTGQKGKERSVAYKLNEIKMSGDDGKFTLKLVLSEKGADGRYPTQELGDGVTGVILKMRWRLMKYEEEVGTTLTSEYENKNVDKVIVFGSGEKGIAVEIKEKLGLKTERVLYVYMPKLQQVVRIIVKASALSSEKNPDGQLGLFDYVDSFNEENLLMNDYMTEFGSVYREDDKNKRKSYYAMKFSRGRILTDAEAAKINDLIKEVYQKTTATRFADEYVPPTPSVETPASSIPDDEIPFN